MSDVERRDTTRTGAREGARSAPLAMDAEAFRREGHRLVDAIARHLETLPERPLVRSATPEQIRATLGGSRELPEEGTDAGELLEEAAALLFEHSLFNGHPRFFGYITSSPAPIGMLGDLLASAVNANVGGWRLSPMASEIEAQAVRWIAELLGYPEDAGGLFVSGGNVANFVGTFAARVAAADWDLRRSGLRDPEARTLRVYGSRETHTWIEKACDLAGLGTDAMRWIETDDRLRMTPDALRAAIERDRDAGDLPMMVVGTAGSVSTGAVDPLFEIAEIAREAGAWFHVDGAYGALAAAVPDAPDDLRALELADSVAVDPHKWLYAPLEAGCVLARDPEALRAAFAYHPRYYHFGEPATNYVDFGPQNSRGFRALKVWLQLRQVGRAGYERMIGEDIRLARRLYDAVDAHPDLEAASRELSIVTFRYRPGGLDARRTAAAGADGSDDGRSGGPRPDGEPTEAYLDALNEEILERVQRSGEAFVSNAVVDDRYLLRACIVNFNTGEADVDALPGIVARIGREVDGEMRG